VPGGGVDDGAGASADLHGQRREERLAANGDEAAALQNRDQQAQQTFT
jgi:hypothetical protein